jgi:hypothetical protein
MTNKQTKTPQYLTFPLNATRLNLSAGFEGRGLQDPFGDLEPKAPVAATTPKQDVTK